jgi:Uma2 family endonuclease
MRKGAAEFMTLAEYEALPADDAYIDEVSRGMLVREPRPGQQHGEIVAELTYLLRGYLETRPVGRIVTEGGFLLSTAPLTLRGPDVAFVRAERLSSEKNPRFFRGAPDLAIEVVSPSNRAGEILQKIAELLDAGTQIAWIVYPATQTVAEHTGAGDVRVLHANDLLTAPELLPGFELRVARIFE